MSLPVLDWRRRVAGLYDEVRRSQDPSAAHARWCAVRADLIENHPASPVPTERRGDFGGLRHAPYDPALRFALPLDRDVEPARIEVVTGTDGVVPFSRVGRLHLPGLGSLDAWWLESYGGGLFVPVKDASAGRSTYGGGRYLLDTVKGADHGSSDDGLLIVDLNFAYNPSCAYDPAWACPLAPPGNVLAVGIDGGELIPSS